MERNYLYTKKEKKETLLKALEEVRSSPGFANKGFTMDIRDNNTIVLRASEGQGMYCHKLTSKDSEDVLNLLIMNVKADL